MNEWLRKQILGSPAERKYEITSLEESEIEQPLTVVWEFFDIYSLSDIRIFLEYWRKMALENPMVDHQDIETLHLDMQRLVEAVWVELLSKKQNR